MEKGEIYRRVHRIKKRNAKTVEDVFTVRAQQGVRIKNGANTE